MLPPDAPFLETALALLALPFRPVTAGVSPVSAGLLPTPLARSSASASCQAHVKAVAEASASGLIRKIAIDPREYPIIQWRWKIADILKNGNVYQKQGDDYPTQVYIVFEYDSERLGFAEKAKSEMAKMLYGEYPPLASINYIWSSNAPLGLVVPNPYIDRSMMVVVQSGKEDLNTWVDEERNLYEDYRNAFKEEPPMISGVAIMTDTDDTGESATAYYGDIVFRKDLH